MVDLVALDKVNPMKTLSELRRDYDALNLEILKAEKADRKAAIKQVRQIMKDHGIYNVSIKAPKGKK